jgi:S1-C subfamily serine protease
MKLVFQSGPRAGQERRVEPGQAIVIGRDQDCDIPLDDTRVSRRHARLRVDATGTAAIEDLGSTNGTFVNGRRIEGATVVQEGDSISIGNSRGTLAGDAAVGGGASTVVASTSRPSGGLTVMRTSLARANTTARVAIGLAILVLIVAIVGAGLFLANRPATNDQIVANMRPSVVVVESRTSVRSGWGTGWVLDADKGLIVTNAHVISGGQDFTVSGEGVTARRANVVAAAPCDDLAVVHVDDKAGLVSTKLGSQSALKQGDDVIALGYPATDAPQRNLVVTVGTVAVVKTAYNGAGSIAIPNIPNAVQTTARINHGNSGGPLVTRASELIGVNSYGNEQTDENYAIGVDRVKEVTTTLKDGHGLAWTGMAFTYIDPREVDQTGQPLRAQVLAKLGLPDEPGLIVLGVVPGTAAADAGFGTAPILVTAVDGRPMDGSLATYCDATGGKQNGSTSKFSIAVSDGQGGVVRQDVSLNYR